ncbi:MAG: indole-3-glycerol phosphate synthase TrpC [Candidatus Omnitrophota bacterium]
MANVVKVRKVSFLAEIIAYKRDQVLQDKKRRSTASLDRMAHARVSNQENLFYQSLTSRFGPAIIAEIKRCSPSKGLLRSDFDPVGLAAAFESAGASALSVLTDAKYFGGSLEILSAVRRSTHLPILRKDFVVDEYQIAEAKAFGADAVLLIAAVLSAAELKRFGLRAQRYGLDVVYEVHDSAELKKILPLKPKIVGVNNRDLKTFKVDLGTTERLLREIPTGTCVVAESGIKNSSDIRHLAADGAKAFLVGETLMKHKNPGQALQKLWGIRRDSR